MGILPAGLRHSNRYVPLAFAGGLPEKVDRVRELLPDAAFGEWETIGALLQQALARPPADPKVPETFEGYRGVPLPKKLGISEGTTVTLLGAPAGFEEILSPMPEKVIIRRSVRCRAQRVLLFVKSMAELERRFRSAGETLSKGGALWICWPKKASGVPSDLTQKAVRTFGHRREFVDFKVCSIDDTWSGLCFVPRPLPGKSRN